MYGYGYNIPKQFERNSIVGFLDNHSNAAIAIPLRDVKGGYSGPGVRVRRSSDDLERDFKAREIGSTLVNWVNANGTSDGLVTKVYHPEGGFDVTQTAELCQPKIVDAGVLVTENGKPGLLFDGVDDDFDMPSTITGDHSIFIVSNNKGNTGALLSGGNYFIRHNFADRLLWNVPDISNSSLLITSGASNKQLIISAIKESGTKYLQFNNVTELSSASVGALSDTPDTIGNYVGAPFAGIIQELYIYPVGKYSDKEDIKTELNDYYEVY